MRFPVAPLVATVVLAVAAVGCGGTDPATDATTATGAKPPLAHTTPAPVARLRRGLRAAGIGGVRILYVDSAKTPVEGAEVVTPAEGAVIVKIMHNHPRTGLASVHGQLIVYMANQNGLTGKERTTFEQATKIIDALP
jgi:hypothetical protein